MQQNCKKNFKKKKKKHYQLQKIEDYNLTKKKYFEYMQLYKTKNKSSQTKFFICS